MRRLSLRHGGGMALPGSEAMLAGRRGLLLTAAVVAVNVALLAGLRGAYAAVSGDADTVVLLLLGVIAAQVNLLSIWAACGRTHWLLRGVVAAAGIACLGLLLCALEPGAVVVPFMVTSIVGAVVVQTLCVAGPLAVGRVFGARLQRVADDELTTATGRRRLQFSVSYLLLAITVVALTLMAGRELARLKPEVRSRKSLIFDVPPPPQTPPALLLRRVLATWSVCAGVFGLAATKATLAARRTWWAVPPAALLALAVCPLFAWLNTDSTYAWRFALTGALHAMLVLGSLLAVRWLGYRLAPAGRPRHVLSYWLGLLVFTAVVAAGWRAAHAQPWLAHQRIVFEGNGGLAFSPDGALLAIQRDHRTIELRDARTLRRVTTLQGDGLLSLVAFSPHGTSLICCEDPILGPYKAWNLAGKRWEALAETEYPFETAVTFDGRVLVAEDAPPGVVVRDLTTGRVVSRTALPDWDEGGASFMQYPDHAKFSPDGATMALSVELMHMGGAPAAPIGRSARELWLVPVADAAAPTVVAKRLTVSAETFSPTGQLLTLDVPAWSGRHLCYVRSWDPATGRESRRFPVLGRWKTLAASPDGTTLALAGGRRNPLLSALLVSGIGDLREWIDYVGLWDIRTARPICGFVVAVGARNLAFSPDGKTLAAAAGNRVYLWDVAY